MNYKFFVYGYFWVKSFYGSILLEVGFRLSLDF